MEKKVSNLSRRRCVPCEGGVPSLSLEQAKTLLLELQNWELSQDGKKLIRNLQLENFQSVLDLANQIGACAEKEGHHPNLYIHRYKKLRIELSTHAIGGLTENDFILAAKIDEIVKSTFRALNLKL